MDFLAIGDTVIDTFIKLKDAQVTCDIDNEHCTITMGWGDKIPFESATRVPAVGNSANAAVAAARLGLSTALVSGLGHDRDGEDCLAAFQKEKVSTDLLEIKEGAATSNNYVLWYGPERTILVKYVDFIYSLPAPAPTPRVVYLSAIGEANVGLHDQVADWLEAHPEILLAFQPGTFEITATEKLARIYARANIVIANKQEYQRILNTKEEDVKKLLQLMQAKGPKICFLTDGPSSSYALEGATAWQVPVYPDGLNAYERTGAGDAFSATVVCALLSGKSVQEALAWGPINAASVVQKIGAQAGLLTLPDLAARLASALADYKVIPF